MVLINITFFIHTPVAVVVIVTVYIIIIISYSSNINWAQIQEIQMRSFNEYVFTYEVIKHVLNQNRKNNNIENSSLSLQFPPQFLVFKITDTHTFWGHICWMFVNDFA